MKRIQIPTSPAILLCCLFGVLIGAGGYTFREGEGLAYLGSESKTCANCHIMRDQYDGWQKASHHAAATCNDCHVPHGFIPKYLTKGENGFEHSKAFTLQNFHEPILIKPKSARIVQKNCIRCHGDLVNAMLANDPGSDKSFTCARCHDGVGHGPKR
jgi:cytochrome c nitrite reductase small subunit